jgi:hypothetical protein
MKPLLVTLTLFLLALSFVRSEQIASEGDTVSEARRLWELAVVAKGGRQILEQVGSLAVFYEYRRRHVSSELYVFPDRHWDWLDPGPSPMFPVMSAAMDFGKNIYCYIHGNLGEGCSSIGNLSKRAYMEDPQLLYLLETKWVKPELLTATKATLEWRSVDLVKIRQEEFQISVYFDAKTHLPVRIAYHVDEDGGKLKAGDIFEWYGLSQYRDVNGIMLPHKITHTHNPTRWLKYEINPAFDPDVFKRKPNLTAGPEQWRPKKPSQN